ncbi:hypothetical protein C6361_01795 [Plantactinospora sp. BC1]|nr:hypothetical protein C6361_01795 [Plantactinospora sp. BC1]
MSPTTDAVVTHEESGRKLPSGRTFIRFWTAQTVSQLGDEVFIVALPLIVYATTRSAGAMSIAFGMTMVPHIALGILGGALADRFDQRRLLATLSAAATAALLVLAAMLHFGAAGPVTLAVSALLLACLLAALLPGYESCIPRIVPAERLVSANSRLEVSRIVCAVVGPGLAGLLVTLGPGVGAIVFDAASFLVAGLLLLSLPPLAPRAAPRRPATTRNLLREIGEGIGLAFRTRSIRLGMLLSTTTNVCVGALHIVAIFQLRDRFDVPAPTVGLIMTGTAIFSLVVAALPRLQRRLGYPGTLAIGLLLSMVACLLMARPAHISWVIGALALETCGATVFNVGWRAMRQQVAGAEAIGRISGVSRGVAFLGAAVGGWLGGAVAASAGLSLYLYPGAAVIAGLVALALLRLPGYLARDLAT